MKLKTIAFTIAAGLSLVCTSSAVTIGLTGIAQFPTPGPVTLNGSAVSGRAIFVSTTDNRVANGLAGALSAILSDGGSSADFDSALSTLIGATSATDPGIVRTSTFVSGNFVSVGPAEVGSAGNNILLFLVAENGTAVSGIGAFSGGTAPPLGATTISPVTAGDLLGTSNAGFQLVGVVPEPSIAILGGLGFLGLLRRRR